MLYDLLLLTGETVTCEYPREHFRNAVRKGIAWIEKTFPQWKEPGNLDINAMNMQNGNACILGQLGINMLGINAEAIRNVYTEVLVRINESDIYSSFEWSRDHGFSVRMNSFTIRNYNALTDQWLRELARYPQFRSDIEDRVNIRRKILGWKPIVVPGLKQQS